MPAPAAPMTSAQTAEPPPGLPSVPPSSAAAAIPAPPSDAKAQSAQSDAAAQGGPTGAEDSRIVLRARNDAWMQVRERGGQVLLNRVLRAGETWPVPAKPALVLTTGNAGGTELLVDGFSAPSIGSSGAVRRDLPLDPDAIKEGKLPAQLQAAAQGSIAHNTPAQ
jgi:cytoskeleton protein RodZ